MRKRLMFLAAFALSLAAFAGPAPAQAREANISFFSGQTAEALFLGSDPSGCSDVLVIVTKSRSYTSPGPATRDSSLFISISQDCHAFTATATLARGEYKVEDDLHEAWLRKSINVCNDLGSCFDAQIAITWRAIGRPTFQHDHLRTRSPGCYSDFRSFGLTRAAVASGRISDGIANFTPLSTKATGGVADLMLASSGQITIGC